MKSKIILILVISFLIIGCIDIPKSILSNNNGNNNQDSEKNIVQKHFILEIVSNDNRNYESFNNELFRKINECNKLTTIQCDEIVNNEINGKYVRLSGTIRDVKNNEIDVYDIHLPNLEFSIYGIEREKLIKYNKGDNIIYTAKLYLKRCFSRYELSFQDGECASLENIELEQPTISSNQSNVQSGISSVTPTKPTTYHIDTLPPGMGIVYINDKISPTTGTLPPGSYNIKLVIGNKTYESTMSGVGGGSIELIQPVPTVTQTLVPRVTQTSNIIPIRPPR